MKRLALAACAALAGCSPATPEVIEPVPADIAIGWIAAHPVTLWCWVVLFAFAWRLGQGVGK